MVRGRNDQPKLDCRELISHSHKKHEKTQKWIGKTSISYVTL